MYFSRGIWKISGCSSGFDNCWYLHNYTFLSTVHIVKASRSLIFWKRVLLYTCEHILSCHNIPHYGQLNLLKWSLGCSLLYYSKDQLKTQPKRNKNFLNVPQDLALKGLESFWIIKMGGDWSIVSSKTRAKMNKTVGKTNSGELWWSKEENRLFSVRQVSALVNKTSTDLLRAFLFDEICTVFLWTTKNLIFTST